jgi:putative transposon-encoded protein
LKMPSQYFHGENTVETRGKKVGNSAETWIEDIPNIAKSFPLAVKKHSFILKLEVVSTFETTVTVY